MSEKEDSQYKNSNNKNNSLQIQENYRIILEINNAIISHLNINSLFLTVADMIREKLPFDCSAICLYNLDRDLFQLYSFGKDMAISPSVEIPREGSHCGWAFNKKKILIESDLSKNKRFFTDKILLDEGILSYVVSPLISREKVIGTLNLGCFTPNKFEDLDLDFHSLITKQIALAVDNARSHEEIEKLKNQLELENVSLQEEIKSENNFEEIVGASKSLKEVLSKVNMVAGTDATVLIRGETGTGKELIARCIHDSSKRSERSLIKVNCPAIPSGLIESELFGHEKGAFTGALTKKIGKFELAEGGTIFLDELGDLPLEAQSKLLRVIQEREFERVGGNETYKVDVRVIAATNRDLEEAVKEAKFRADLFYRLNVFPIELPALRERAEDIAVLSNYFMNKYSKRLGKIFDCISEETIKKLEDYSWPGNIRELENIIERVVILCSENELHISENLFGSSKSLKLENNTTTSLDDVERDHIIKILNQTDWQIHGNSGAAKILDINPSTLRTRMVKLGIKKKTVQLNQ
ncbi:MAG: sigma-54-dependent Fis family transcriptional regulator [Thermodesulfobacteriota bacterium]